MTENKTFTRAKAIGILCVIIGHCGCPSWLHDFIYCFHMPLFFIISGYFFKEKYLKTPYIYVKKKVKRLYVPYLLANISFLFLHNILASAGFYDSPYPMTKWIISAMKIVMFVNPEPIVGSLWFLKSMFVAIISVFLIFRLTSKLRNRMTWRICIALLALLAGWHLGDKPMPLMLNRELCVISLIVLGVVFTKYKQLMEIKLGGVFLCLVLVAAASRHGHFDLATARIENPLFLIIVSCIGYIGIINLCRYLPDCSMLNKIGNNTITILIWHMPMIKISQWILFKIFHIDNMNISSYELSNESYWWLFAIVSIIGTYLIILISEKLQQECINRNK